MRALFLSVAVGALGVAGCQTILAPTEEVSDVSGLKEIQREFLVQSQEEYNQVVKDLQPGDTLVLANGEWSDFDLVFVGQGTKERPINLKGETPGGVVLNGQSSLRLAGQHLVVSNLVFKNGYTPRNEVVSFRRDSKTLAFNSRVTNVVIENYNNPDRKQRDTWVAMYGQNNEFDHNHLSGKLNAGPTMIVRLNTEDSQNNNHRIHHNYFGPRPVFGSNGGETFRIGTSAYSLTNSATLVENNYFDRCSGEVEIISNKSGGNIYRGNTFYKSRGTLTLRHGNGTLVENNLFDGGGAPFTGGVRVINAQQTIRNNYFKDLTGRRFSGALVVMNGVPNSPINRYHQVDGAVIEQNTFENVEAIELAEGADAERSAAPVNSTFKNNIVIGRSQRSPFNAYDDVSGISFSDNVSAYSPVSGLKNGFSVSTNPLAEAGKGASGAYGVEKDATGPTWYPKSGAGTAFDSGEEIKVSPGENSLAIAVSDANAGDVLVLAPGYYNEAQIISLQKPLTLKSQSDDPADTVITFERRQLFQLSGDGALKMVGLSVSGEKAPDAVGNAFISTTAKSAGGNHVLKLKNMHFSNFTVNRSFAVVEAVKDTFFDKIYVVDSVFNDLTGAAFKLDTETDDFGFYNVEKLVIENSQFKNVRGGAAVVYRGGRDESTFGPSVVVRNSTFENVGSGEPLLRLHGIQTLELNGNTASGSSPAKFTITTGIPKVSLNENELSDADAFLVTEDLRKRK